MEELEGSCGGGDIAHFGGFLVVGHQSHDDDTADEGGWRFSVGDDLGGGGGGDRVGVGVGEMVPE